MSRSLLALLIPLGVLIFIALAMATFRVVLLSFSKQVAPFVALTVALVILFGASYLARSSPSAGEHGS